MSIWLLAVTNEKRLLDNLFASYDKRVRPTKSNTSVIQVLVDYWIVSLISIVSYCARQTWIISLKYCNKSCSIVVIIIIIILIVVVSVVVMHVVSLRVVACRCVMSLRDVACCCALLRVVSLCHVVLFKLYSDIVIVISGWQISADVIIWMGWSGENI